MLKNRLWLIGLIACAYLSLYPATQCCSQVLNGSAALDLVGNTWNYTIINNEPGTSNNWLTSFFLPIDAQVTAVQAPGDWFVQTDDATYILWYNAEAYPYPSDVPPGGSLSGFQFESSAPGEFVSYTLSSWDHFFDQPGPTVSNQILTPGIAQGVPEPGVAYLLAAASLFGIAPLICRKVRM